MSDYIKREDAKDAVINIVGWEKIAKYVDEMSKHLSTKDIDYYDALMDAEDAIDDLPSADVVEVVRCKDCLSFRYDNGITYCAPMGVEMQPTDFCSYGERKDDE